MVRRSVPEISPTFGMRMSCTGKSLRTRNFDSEFFQFFGRESLANIGHRWQTHVRLVDPVQPHRLVVAHARER